jgi:xanthine/uracil permease
MSVIKLPLLVDLQQKVRKIVISITSCHTIIILENTLNQCMEKIVVMVTLATGIMFLLFTCMHFWGWEILRWTACAPTAYEVNRDCRKFEKHWSKLQNYVNEV